MLVCFLWNSFENPAAECEWGQSTDCHLVGRRSGSRSVMAEPFELRLCHIYVWVTHILQLRLLVQSKMGWLQSLLLCPFDEIHLSFWTQSPHFSFTFTHKNDSHVCFCFRETAFVALRNILRSHEMREWILRKCVSFKVVPTEEEGHLMTADIRVGVFLCIINTLNGNKNILLVWAVTPGSDPTEIHLGFYTNSIMNSLNFCL